jgi:hypothetical protein
VEHEKGTHASLTNPCFRLMKSLLYYTYIYRHEKSVRLNGHRAIYYNNEKLKLIYLMLGKSEKYRVGI